MEKIMINTRLKRFIEGLYDLSNAEMNVTCYSVKFTDIDDTFHFDSETEIYDFLHKQVVERFSEKELKKGYFEYLNENNEVVKYVIDGLERGKITKWHYA